MRRSKIIFIALFGIIAPHLSHAQFSMDWQKKLVSSGDTKEVKGISSVSVIDSFRFIGYEVNYGGKDFPAVTVVSPDESVRNITDFSSNKGLDGYRIVAFTKSTKDTIVAYCNHYQLNAAGARVSTPAEMIFTFRNGKLDFLDYYHLNMTDVSEVQKVEITDAIQSDGQCSYIAVMFQKPSSTYVNIYKIKNAKVVSSRTVEKAKSVKFWWADDDNAAISSQTAFASAPDKEYYEIQILDDKMSTVKKFPPTLEYLDPKASDELVDLSYRASYHLGLVARKVTDVNGVKRMNWYGFNSYPDGTRNKLIGENSDVLIVSNIIHPPADEVIYNYQWPGAGQNNWVISRNRDASRPHDDLVFSVEMYSGLELKRDTIGLTQANIYEQLKDNPELIKSIGITDIDRRYTTVKCFTMPGKNSVYIVRNNPKKMLDNAGIMLSKFSINISNPLFSANYLEQRYGRKVHYDAVVVPENDKREWLLTDLDPADPLYEKRDELKGKTLKLESALTPVVNTWFWSGDVRIGKKKYHLTKAVISSPQ